jgi:GT2 family glycosyltransferase
VGCSAYGCVSVNHINESVHHASAKGVVYEPLVSVVIPTYNRAADLSRALCSLRAQTYSHWEALVVDNHSSDETDAVIEALADPRITLYKIHNDGVIAVSRNRGIREARGEYVAFLDSDDWWSERKLAMSVQALRSPADVVYHDLFLVTKPGQKWFWRKARTHSLRSPAYLALLGCGNALTNSSVVVRKTLLDTIGGLSEEKSLVAAEDFDAWLRIAQLTERFVRIPRTLGYYWAGGGTMSNPTRTLGTLTVLEQRHANGLQQVRRSTGASWVDYAKARAYARLGNPEVAWQYFCNVRWRKTPWLLYLKSLWFRVQLRWRHSKLLRAHTN